LERGRCPLDDDVLGWWGCRRGRGASPLENDAALGLGVGQPALDDHRLGFGGQGGQAFDDQLAGRWWQLFACTRQKKKNM